MLLSGYDFLDGALPDLRYRTWFMPGSLAGRRLPPESVDFLPVSWAQTMHEIENEPADVVLVQVSPPDRHGWCSLGVSVSYTLPAVLGARRVIAQVNPRMPRTGGESLVHESRIAAYVPVDAPLPPFPVGAPTGTGAVIAALAADLVPDGATLQPGIGALPSQVLTVLAERGARVRLHSMLTDAGIDLVRGNGTEGRGALVGEVVGSQELYDFVDGNPAVAMAPAARTHGMRALVDLPRFVSVNSALEVDLFGQVNLEYLDGVQAGGVGGSLDFMIAAMLPGNLSVLVMRSSARGGTISRIRPTLGTGPVSIPRTLTQVVITEYGVADLRGATVAERAERLLAIAHPDHRSDLERAWKRLG
jgi:acyl-CoA hydrolase